MTMTNEDVEEQRQKKKFFVCGGPARRICWHILEKQFSKMLTHTHTEGQRERRGDSNYYNTHSPIHAKVQSSTHDCENGIAKVAHDEGELKSCTIFSFFFIPFLFSISVASLSYLFFYFFFIMHSSFSFSFYFHLSFGKNTLQSLVLFLHNFLLAGRVSV